MKTTALKQKILDYSIKGRLTSPTQNDESAYVLLEHIHNQRKKMVNGSELNAKYIKNHTVIFKDENNLHYERFQNGSIKCVENEIPFREPDGWAWCRLKELFCVCSAKRILKSDWTKEGVPFYRAREIAKLSDKEESFPELFISKEHYKKLAIENSIPHAGDLMVSAVGTIGKIYVVNDKDCFYYKDASVLCFENRSGMINPQYAKYMLESSFLQEQMKANSKGTTVDTITISAAMEYMCLLPPLNEQLKIITAIENALKYIKQIQDEQSQLKELITAAKTKILNLAVHGKLVSQDPLDEPASVLLSRIKNEKASLIASGQLKENKKEAVIFKGDDNSYYIRTGKRMEPIGEQFTFELPKGWQWCTLLNVAKVELGKALDKAKNTGNLHPYLRSANIKWNNVKLSDLNKMKFETDELDRYSVRKNDLLICEGGDVGRSCVWEYEREIQYQNALHRARFYDNCNPFYFMYYMMYYESKGVIKHLCKGVTIKHLTENALSIIPFALPPLSEQKRIVYKLNCLFGILDSIIDED